MADRRRSSVQDDPMTAYVRALSDPNVDPEYLEVLRKIAEAGLSGKAGTSKRNTKRTGMKQGGMAMKKGTKTGYAKGGMVSAGASNPATQKRTPKTAKKR